MPSANESEIRLAELIWRTVKLRVSLLALTIVVLLVVWSSLLNGNQEAQKIDTKFCEYLVGQHNTLSKRLHEEFNKAIQSNPGASRTEPLLLSEQEQCHVGSSRTWIEITRHTDEELPLVPLLPPTPDYITRFDNEKKKAFADYDIQRHEAFRLEIHLSSEYSSSTIIVNALTIAKVIPFCVLLVLAVVAILGFQKSAYRRRLRTLLQGKTGDDLSEAMAETQFFAAPLNQVPTFPGKYLALSPVDLAIGALSLALALLLLKITSTFLLSLVQLTDTIILSYPFALYASLILLTGTLVITRKSYLESAQPNAQHQETDSNKQRRSRQSKWLTLTSAFIAGVSLAFPWAIENTLWGGGDFFRGFEFLLNQHPTGHLFNYTTYALSPPIFRDVRIQVTVAVAFLAICVLDALLGFPRANRLMVFLHRVRWLFAVCVFALSVYYLVYMTFLEYESVYWVPWLDHLAYQGPSNAKGNSMLYYDPAYGFWIFLVCCFLLVWLSFTTQTDRLWTWVRHASGTAASSWKP